MPKKLSDIIRPLSNLALYSALYNPRTMLVRFDGFVVEQFTGKKINAIYFASVCQSLLISVGAIRHVCNNFSKFFYSIYIF